MCSSKVANNEANSGSRTRQVSDTHRQARAGTPTIQYMTYVYYTHGDITMHIYDYVTVQTCVRLTTEYVLRALLGNTVQVSVDVAVPRGV